VYEQLYDLGFREFCIVIGRGKRAIEDHFTQDYSFAASLRKAKRLPGAEELEAFYRRLDDSAISWVTQPKPIGFGDAVSRAHRAVGDEEFVVHAGDAYIISKENAHFRRLSSIFQRSQPSAALLIHELANVNQKGVAEIRPLRKDSYEVLSVVEKPQTPTTNLAIEPVYIFRQDFLRVLERTKPDKRGEIQVTDAIQMMISDGKKVQATKLLEDEVRLDVGDAESYWEALSISYKLAKS
jgi:UTP--glucose-1-phosphate uridylyltransferase